MMHRRPIAVRHSRLAAATLLLVALVAPSCGDAGGADDVRSNSTVDGPVVAQPEGNGDGDDALIEGTVRLSSGCLLVGEFPVIWPHGTRWDADTEAVQLSDGQVVALGVRVKGGGGYSHMSDLRPEFAEPLAGCPTNEYEEVAMFNAAEQITVIK
jgi:hypothetical protein